MEITAKKISKGSFFQLLLIALGCGFFFLFVFFGIAATFGAKTVSVNGQAVTGIKGLILALIMWPIFTFFITAFTWLIGILGLWVYSFFKPLEIRFKGEASVQEYSVKTAQSTDSV